MAANALLWKTYDDLKAGIYTAPEQVDFEALAGVIGSLTKAGELAGELNIDLQKEWPLGKRVWDAYSVAKTKNPAMPKLIWHGTKASEHNPNFKGNFKDKLEEVQLASLAGARGNPFAAALASLRS